MGKTRGVRLDDETNVWLDEYAKTRGVEPSAILRTAVEEFMVLCQGGVPEIRQKVQPPKGVGQCPDRAEGEGHVFASPRADPLRSCLFCGAHGREPASNFDHSGEKADQGGGEFAAATRAQTEVFSRLKAPMQSGTGDPGKAWPKGMPADMRARADAIVAEKKLRDAGARK